MTVGGIYEILNTVNGKRYIGSAKNPKQRFKLHRSELNRGVHHSVVLQRAWDKYGCGVFLFRVLVEVPYAELISCEQKHIDEFSPAYNICKIAGNCLGVKHTAEARAKMSASMTPERRAAIGNQHRGKTISSAHKEAILISTIGRVKPLEERVKISAAVRGKKRTPETCAKISAAAKARKKVFGRTHTAETRAKISAAKRGAKMSLEARANISAGHKGHKHSPETRAKIGAAGKAYQARLRAIQEADHAPQ